MADDTNAKEDFTRITNPDGTPVRDKDNAHPTPKPTTSYLRPAPNLAPGGAMGIRQTRAQPNTPSIPAVIIESDIDADTHRYVTGRIADQQGYSFLARVSNEPTQDGVLGSSVDQLVFKQGDKAVFRFNRLMPDTDISTITPEQATLIAGLCETLSPTPTHKRDIRQDNQPTSKEEFTKMAKDSTAWKDTIPSSLALDHNDDPNSPWITGRIVTMPGYTFSAKVHDEPSHYGIDGGQISKLVVRKDGQEVMSYDRGWNSKPKTPEHREALQRIRRGNSDTLQSKSFKGFDRPQGGVRDFER